MFMDRNFQCCKNVCSSQLDLQIQCNPIKIPASYFADIDKQIIKLTWTGKKLGVGDTVFKSKWNSHSLLIRLKNGAATLKDTWVASLKTEHILTILSCNHTPQYLPRGVENMHTHTKTCMQTFVVTLLIIVKLGST